MRRKNRAAQALGRKRMRELTRDERRALGKAGNRAMRESVAPERLAEIARRAGAAGAASRWGYLPESEE